MQRLCKPAAPRAACDSFFNLRSSAFICGSLFCFHLAAFLRHLHRRYTHERMSITPVGHKPRVVVVGYGSAGRNFHCHLIRKSPGLELYGVAARDAETRAKAAAEQRCKTYDGIDAALADAEVDLIVLATPHDTHAPLAIAALNAGKHVVTDKVMCLSLAECDAMIAAAQKAKKLLT